MLIGLRLFILITAFGNCYSLMAADPGFALQSVVGFKENKGQVHDQFSKARPDVLFSSTDGKLVLHIKDKGISYQLPKIESYKMEKDKYGHLIKEIDKVSTYRIDVNWLNCATNYVIQYGDIIQGYDNYYLEHCPNGILNVRSYEGVTLKNLYDKVDLHYYSSNEKLKYDFVVHKGGDYKNIKLEVNGAEIIQEKNGGILLSTTYGNVEEGAPVVFQNGKQLVAKWIVTGNVLSFDVEGYNPAYELVIDPIARVWGTYYGGSTDDRVTGCSASSLNEVYISGFTDQVFGTGIATSGAHQSSPAGGAFDAFLAKFNSAGARQWGTFYGGTGNDRGNSCSVDPSGNIILTGITTTSSGTLIASPGAFQTTLSGGSDAFVVKFNSSGVRIWGTYFGSNAATASEAANSCATDALGNIYIVGVTWGLGSGISTPGTYQTSYSGSGTSETFLAKFDPNGNRVWGTYYGTSLNEDAYDCCADAAGNVYMVGYTAQTFTTSVLASIGAHQTSIGGGTADGFLAKFDNTGNRVWGTYYGGSQSDYIYSCELNSSGEIYVAGLTQSTSSISTAGTHQFTNSGSGDGFLVKFNGSGARQWGTYYGGTGIDDVKGLSVDIAGNIFIAGNTSSNGTSIASGNVHQLSNNGGTYDAYLVKINSSGIRQWGTFYGGSANETLNGCCVDASGNLYISGITTSTTGISQLGHQNNHAGGGNDGFLTKFSDCPDLNLFVTSNSPICTGAALNFSTTTTYTGSINYNWNGPYGFSSTLASPSIPTATVYHTGTFTLSANVLNCGVIEKVLTPVTVNPNPTISVNSGSICVGKSFTISPTGASTYTIQGGSSIVSPTSSTSYTVIGTSSVGCAGVNTATSNITILPSPAISVSGTPSICLGGSAVLSTSGASTYSWSTGATSSSVSVSPTITSTYSVTGTNTAGCSSMGTFSLTVNTCTGFNEYGHQLSSVLVYPNPTTGLLSIEFQEEDAYEITISDLTGRKLKMWDEKNKEAHLDITELSHGVYVVSINSVKQRVNFKIIKK